MINLVSGIAFSNKMLYDSLHNLQSYGNLFGFYDTEA